MHDITWEMIMTPADGRRQGRCVIDIVPNYVDPAHINFVQEVVATLCLSWDATSEPIRYIHGAYRVTLGYACASDIVEAVEYLLSTINEMEVC